jgi:hypothetical protein
MLFFTVLCLTFADFKNLCWLDIRIQDTEPEVHNIDEIPEQVDRFGVASLIGWIVS